MSNSNRFCPIGQHQAGCRLVAEGEATKRLSFDIMLSCHRRSSIRTHGYNRIKIKKEILRFVHFAHESH